MEGLLVYRSPPAALRGDLAREGLRCSHCQMMFGELFLVQWPCVQTLPRGPGR